MENEDVSYISYRNEEDINELWRISPITKIAEFIPIPKEPSEYFTRCSKQAKSMDIKYITEYLIPLGYCEFERDGDQLHFKQYDDDPEGTIMKTKTCDTCSTVCIINIEETACMSCRSNQE